MEQQFIPYQLAFQLKELGFNEPCLAHYYTKDNKFEGLEFLPKEDYGELEPNFIINSNKYYYISTPLTTSF